MNKRDFGHRLVVFRRERNLTGQQLADLLGISQSKVSKIECGAIRPTREFVEGFAQALSLSPAEREEVLALADLFLAEHRPWMERPEAASEAKEQAVSKLQLAASELRSYELAFVPWLLQTEQYTRALLLALKYPGGAGSPDLDREVRERVRRQKKLFSSKKRFFFLMAEGALRTRIGRPALMEAQLARVKELSERDNVQIGMVPWEARLDRVGMTGFDIYDCTLAVIGTVHGDLGIADCEAVRGYRELFDSLSGVALYGSGLTRAIDRIASELQKL